MGPAGVPFGVGGGAVAEALGHQNGVELVAAEEDDDAFGMPVPAIGGFASEEKFEEVVGALDAINFGVAAGGGGFLAGGVGAGGKEDGDAKGVCFFLEGLFFKGLCDGLYPGGDFAGAVGEDDDIYGFRRSWHKPNHLKLTRSR